MEQVNRMNPINSSNPHPTFSSNIVTLLGAALVLIGAIILLDQYLHTGWLIYALFPLIGLALIFFASRARRYGWLIPGLLVAGIGLGAFFAFSPVFSFTLMQKIGCLLLGFAAGWILIGAWFPHPGRRAAYWALIPGGIILGAGLTFFTTRIGILDFVLYCGVFLGLAFLFWGLAERLFGLIIPGALLVTIAPGVALAWQNLAQPNGLTQTGIMLVWFALGWGLITVFSRVITEKFIWWPLIPGGILAVVGWGLYIGGNPGGAASFIGNTGAIGLIIFGVYLLLLRQGIRR